VKHVQLGREKNSLGKKTATGMLLALLVFSILAANMIMVAAQEKHDVAVVSVIPSATLVEKNDTVNIMVIVENQGTESETFNVTTYRDNTAIATRTVENLGAGANTSLTVPWSTTEWWDHSSPQEIKATASTVPGETDIVDNTFVSPNRIRVYKSPYVGVVPFSTVNSSLTIGTNYTVSIYTDYNGSDITGWQFDLSYNPYILHGVEVTNGDLIVAQFIPGKFDNTVGKLSNTVGFFFSPGAVTSGPGILANVTFTVVGLGDSYITLGDATKLKGWNSTIALTYNIVSDWEPGIFHLLHGYFRNIAEPITHDIAILSVTPSQTWIVTGEPVNVTVVVKNNGTRTEKGITIKFYRDYWFSETQTISTLEAGANTSLIFTWDETDIWPGTYLVRVVADAVHGEMYTENNALNEKVIVSMFYIRSNGSIDPSWAPILSVDNVTYTFTSDILNVSIGVKRDDIVVDGAAYTLQAKEGWHSHVTGIDLSNRNNVTIKNLEIKGFGYGIWLYSSSNNTIYHNNFIDNTKQVYILKSGYGNLWDAGYPSGGNYWSDYEERYPNATEIDDSGIWDTPYFIDENNQDNYPLVNPWETTEPENLPPTAQFTYSPTSPIVSETVTFDSSLSYDPDGTIVGYSWAFGDGMIANDTGPITTHAYADAGNYAVTLYVYDDDYQPDSYTLNVTVTHQQVPKEATQELTETIETWNLHKGTENSLKAKLKVAIHMLDMGKEDSAIRKLTDFINRAEMLREKTLTNEQADQLISEAQRIADLING